ncbi:nucleotide sugar dehydrogenase [Paenibacillus thailandensis]|uniref:Nucleotide sugar dehydrogenase n=1 Tax=Paenibacillus thailandensis TaxID=393250 RepID=A0ABW5QXM1_9BACL
MASNKAPLGAGRRITAAVVGLGYVGLPLSLLFCRKGYSVIGIDTDPVKIATLNHGKSYLPDVQNTDVQSALASGNFRATGQYDDIRQADAILICVPTPLDGSRAPDLSRIEAAGREIGRRIVKGQLVSLESSTYPGTTSRMLRPLLEASGLKVGTDIFLGHSPERLDPSNYSYPLEQIPKVISGITDACLRRMSSLYGSAFERIVPVSSTEAAEMAKLLENTYRLVNVSFANEIAMLCDALQVDVWEIIDAASTKPFGFHPFYPGPSAGGHCIPVDPLYLQWAARQTGLESRFVALADEINRGMPAYIVSRIALLMTPQKPLKEARILLIGAAYKKDTGDIRESGAVELLKLLKRSGADIRYHDPYVPMLQLEGERMASVDLTDELLTQVDCVLIAADHASVPFDQVMRHARLVFDTRNATSGLEGAARVYRLGGGAMP